MVSRSGLNSSMGSAFDEVRHHWPTYIADAADLDMHQSGQILKSDRLGPIVETDSRKWRATVVGRGLTSASLTFFWWNAGERRKAIPLKCAPNFCSGDLLLDRGFQRVELTAARVGVVAGFILSSGRPPLFDDGRVDAIPARMDALTKLLVPSSYNGGWALFCSNATVPARVGNYWATLYAPGRAALSCAARYWPNAMENIGIFLSLIVLAAVVSAPRMLRRLAVLRSARRREGVIETTA
jgi:hypothetical protein